MRLEIITDDKDIAATEQYLYRIEPGRLLPLKLITIGGPVVMPMLMAGMCCYIHFTGVLTTQFIVICSLLSVAMIALGIFFLPRLRKIENLGYSEELEINQPHKSYLRGARIVEIDPERIKTTLEGNSYELYWSGVDFSGEDDSRFFVYPKTERENRVVIPKDQISASEADELRSLLRTHTRVVLPAAK